QDGVSPLAVFRAPLSSGQILLLFAEVVPREQSTQLLEGVPVSFQHESPFGLVDVHMTLSGDDLRVTARAARKGAPALVPISGGPNAAPRRGDQSLEQTQVRRPVPAPPSGLRGLIAEMSARRATHLHVSPVGNALLRVDGRLVPVASGGLSAAQLHAELTSLAPAALREELARHVRFDFTHVTDDAVFHLASQQSRAGLSLVVRRLDKEVPAPGSLGLPGELVQAMSGAGLWVLAGPPGHGVTTSLASVTQSAAHTRAVSVRTLEAPIQYVLSAGPGPLEQLEVGAHVGSFREGLRDALRDDVDVVMVSELDDADVLAEALVLAERGRLVVGTLHARSAASAAEKLVHLTAGDAGARWRLGQSLRGIFAQVLCPNTMSGRSLAWELLPGVAPVRSAVVDGRASAFPSLRTRTLEQGLAELVTGGLVERDDALAVAPDRAQLEASLGHLPPVPRAA
ncbi:MAG: Flp pilus assembly complex ATPase component TadA, partial [Myxococcaceae bacterium]|nr:Flp pilus assembly complex ATPase component TadA [Myxococcaceae bacterium]